MPILDALIGQGSIDRQQDFADEAARERFDPDQFLPQLREAQTQAQEGIADEEIRGQFLNRLFSQQPIEQQDVGASSGRFLSMMGEQANQRTEAIGEFEAQVGLEEERAKREGRSRTAEIMGKRRQLEQQREAQIAQNRLTAEAEASRRKKQLGVGLAQLAGTAATAGGLGPLAAGGIGAGTGLLFGGGGAGAVAGGISGAGSALNLGDEEEEETEDSTPRQDTVDFISSLEENEISFIRNLLR